MQPEDYEIYVVRLDMKVARPQDKVEIMEETQWVVTSDFLKTGCQLKKKDEQLKTARERVSFLERKEKSLEADIARMTERTLIAEDERNRFQSEIAKIQVADARIIKELQGKNQEAQQNL